MDAALQHILDGCIRKRRSSQKDLYYRYYNLFLTICLRYIPNRAEAEEALNNAYLRIFRHIDQYNQQGSFEGWMKRIVANCCLTYISRPAYTNQSKVIPLQTPAENEQGNTVGIEIGASDEALEAKYQKEQLLSLIQQLPEPTRQVFNLYVFEDYNHQEIGAALDMAERTSQAHLAKARKMLSESLDKKEWIRKMERV